MNSSKKKATPIPPETGPYAVHVVTQEVSFGVGTDQKSSVKRYRVTYHDKPVLVGNMNAAALVTLEFSEEEFPHDLAASLNHGHSLNKTHDR